MEACCTCARLLSAVPVYSEKSEKHVPQDRQLECCGRVICGDCLHKNPRFETYCPYCQTSKTPSPLPSGLRDPPAYTTLPPNPSAVLLPPSDAPPPYTAQPPAAPRPSSPSPSSPPPLLHYLNHATDTIPSLSLRYSTPAPALRALNRLTSDHLLAARRTILIPVSASPSSSSSQPPTTSLSPTPPEGEAESARKHTIRRWMVATKTADYDVALLYLEQAGYDLARAVDAFRADEAWEWAHPLDGGGGGGGARGKKGKGLLRIGAGPSPFSGR